MAEDMISTSFNGQSLEQGSMPNFRSFKDDLVRVALFLEDEESTDYCCTKARKCIHPYGKLCYRYIKGGGYRNISMILCICK